MKWIKITETSNIPKREGRSVKVGSHEIAIFNLGDRFLAIQNSCPHGGGPLADGIVSGNSVVCPLHGWKTCLESGEVQRPKDLQSCVRRYPVKVEEGVVLVQIEATAKGRETQERMCTA
ncbi:MAG: nitrite reductase small subunit NirD [Acidimicrobiia bacterium]|nr:nitrite reductase small subunit NirD [Acidimicrobiia bacterium]